MIGASARRRGGMGITSRRMLMGGAAACGLVSPPARAAETTERRQGGLPARIRAHFRGLPGTRAMKIWAPATASGPELRIAENAGEQLFIGSAIKAFVLCERLRQLDSEDVASRIVANQLALDESVWSADSASFNPPHLTGKVSERSAMEAMILHSDNTATDMVLKATGPDRVRAFLAEAGLRNSLIPDSTRSFFGYLLGVPDYRSFTWAELLAAEDKPIVNAPLNPEQSLASSAEDLVAFYAASVQGGFFQHAATLQQYRNVLSLGDVIHRVLPLGGSAFAKGGSIDVRGYHALCAPGAVFLAGRWLYFAFILNWYSAAETDPATVARYLAAVQAAMADLYAALG
jgi:beta-lactamase class A